MFSHYNNLLSCYNVYSVYGLGYANGHNWISHPTAYVRCVSIAFRFSMCMHYAVERRVTRSLRINNINMLFIQSEIISFIHSASRPSPPLYVTMMLQLFIYSRWGRSDIVYATASPSPTIHTIYTILERSSECLMYRTLSSGDFLTSIFSSRYQTYK